MLPAQRLALPAGSASRRRLLIVFGAVVAAVAWVAIVGLAEPYDWSTVGTGHDARPYWDALADRPYATSVVGAHNAYLYSPAFLEVVGPLRALPWQAFMGFWTLILIVAALYLVGPVLLGFAVIVALPEILGGNITLLIAAAIVLGFRWPAAWAFVALTKVTPGVGLVWFAVRREWRQLAIAIGATVAVVVGSYVVAPAAWGDWIAVLTGNATRPIESGSFPVPLLVRLPIAIVLIAWGARGNRRWVMPIGCLLALPVIWYGSLALLVAIVPLIGVPRLGEWHWPAVLADLRAWRVRRVDRVRASAAPAGR